MLLTPEEAKLFYKLYPLLLFFVNERLGIAPEAGSPYEFATHSAEKRHEVRDALLDDIDLIELFADANPFDFSDEELEVVLSWRHLVAGRFFLFRYLKKHAIFLPTEGPTVAYGVVALTDPLEDIVGPYLPLMVDAVLLPLRDRIVYDGLITSYNISFGGGIQRMLNDSYKEAKEQFGIVTSLPMESRPAAKSKPKKARPKKAGRLG
jgi:hypothetical protein